MIRACALVAVLALAGCASVEPPRQAADACAVFDQKPAWWRAAKRVERRWGAPPALTLAIIRHESSFHAQARPPRRDGFLFLPGKRPSSAYGYAQALDGTWAQYQRAAGERGADRDDFEDAADFVGWYAAESRRRLGLSWSAVSAHYLAYHEGHGGFERRTYRGKAWLLRRAGEVAQTYETYRRQLDRCEGDLNRGGWMPFL